MKRIPVLILLLLLVLAGLPAQADARSEEKCQVKFAGFVGKMVNLFGGKAAREGVVTLTSLKGDRLMSQTADNGELISLGEEKVYTIDFKKKSFKVQTFEEIRRQFKEDMERAKEDMARQEPPPKNAPQYEWEVDLKETGKKETISGYSCREVVLTVIGHEKGKKLEQGGGIILTSDLWLGPRIKELEEIHAFHLLYAQKLGLLEMFREQGMMAAMAAYPALQEAMRKLEEKRVNLEGTPVRTVVTAESVAAPGQPAASEGSESGGTSLGGMLGKLGKKLSKSKSEAGNATPGRSTIFTGTTELLRVGSSVATEDVSIPAGFKQR